MVGPCVRSLCGTTGGDGAVGYSVSSGMSVVCVADNADGLVLVNLVFFLDWRILPFAFSLLSGRYFWISLTVSPDQVAKKMRLMAAIHVRFGGQR